MRPGAVERGVKMIAASLSLVTAHACRTIRAVWRQQVMELPFGTDKAATGPLCVVPAVMPVTFNHDAQGAYLLHIDVLHVIHGLHHRIGEQINRKIDAPESSELELTPILPHGY